jgi:hypothetical protein
MQQVQHVQQLQNRPVPIASAQSSSYYDSIINKRRDVLKIIILAITIVLGISIHYVVDFSLREVFVTNDLGFKQEFGARLLYPIVIVIMIWLLKAIGSK